MNTFFAHHDAVHNSGNRALFVSTVSILLVVGLVTIVAMLVKNGGDK